VRAALLIGNHLSRHGHTVKVCEELATRLRSAGWPILTASDRLSPALRLADMTATIWRERRSYDVAQVDVYSGRAFLWAEAAALALRACRKPFAVTLHGGALPQFAQRWPGRVRRLLELADEVTTPSAYLARAFSCWRPGIRMIPNAIDGSRHAPRQRARPAPKLIWLRAFHEIYDSILAVETLAELRRDIPNATLTMIGPDKGDGSLGRTRAAVERLRLPGAVAFEGFVDKPGIPERLASGDIFLNTARIDNLPVSVLEAMASGLCIVSTKVGGIPDLLDHERDALLVPAGDAGAMAAAVRRILHEPGLAARLSANARRKAAAFDWAAVLPHWEALLGEMGRCG
jgi:glycosyltransferase involved in cell wall biosynthesis